jgi:RimJ/RimL family protein N-acetyltransferase
VSLYTKRLELVPATPEFVRAALSGNARLQETLGVEVPPTWPHQYLDAPAFQYILQRLEQDPLEAGWWLHFVVRSEGPTGRLLIGSAGYKGKPAAGVVEIGYGIVSDQQRRGYASEAVEALLGHAFSFPSVGEVIAETLPELVASIGVLQKAGFRGAGRGSEEGVIRFALSRTEYDAR